ncbi:MAG TPA: metal ABC transporter permease [Anaerolineaceae bacterium]
MIAWLIEPWTHQFMLRALAASVLVGVVCAVVGCYVVLRSMAFMGDALAHAILPGVAIAYLLGGNLLIGALAAAVLVALGIGFFTRGGAIKEDTAIGILFAAALSLGVALISSVRTYALDLSHILFGDVLGVSPEDLILTAVLALVILGTILMLYKELLVVAFDPILATTMRLPVSFIRNLLLVMLAVTVVVALNSVGVGLAAAMLVTPAATAYLLTRRLPVMMVLSAMTGVISSMIGLYLSYYWNIASGAAIVLSASALFLIVFLFSSQTGVLRQVYNHFRRIP